MFNIPPDIKEFYIRANPVDVEIRTKKFGNLHFFPLEEMEVIKRNTRLCQGCFYFASTNGDPVFIRNSHYYITCESRFKPELLSDDLKVFGHYKNQIKLILRLKRSIFILKTRTLQKDC